MAPQVQLVVPPEEVFEYHNARVADGHRRGKVDQPQRIGRKAAVPEESMDGDDHLEEHQLEVIRSWPDTNYPGLMEYVESLWRMGEWGWKQQKNPFTGRVASRAYQVSTGGWSANKKIIAALESNRPFWEQCWVSYRAGGHYEFKVKSSAGTS